jgi:hypothetical protein
MNELSQPSGKQLLAALTDEQIERLLDVVASTGALAKLDQPLQAIDPDLAQTVRALLGSTETHPLPSPEAVASTRKARETWNELWGQWESHVSEVGDEKGDYAIQEHERHPPYFDPTALADDLEKVAQPMLEWLDRICLLVKEPELFAQAIKQIDENISDYPDWMQSGDEFCGLGPQATNCVLRWTWRACEGHPAKGREFLQRIYRLQQESKHVGLDEETCFKSFAALPAECCREIHAGLGEEEYTEARNDMRSVWHRIHHHLEQTFDPWAYLQSCEDHLPEDWHYGEALIADALVRKDCVEAERWMERTFASFLRWTEDEAWCPEDSLLPPAGHIYYGAATSDDALKLLAQWEQIASKRKAPARVATCRLQRVLLPRPRIGRRSCEPSKSSSSRVAPEKSPKSSLPNGGTGLQPNARINQSRSNAPKIHGSAGSLRPEERPRRTRRSSLIISTCGWNAFKGTPHSSKSNGVRWPC